MKTVEQIKQDIQTIQSDIKTKLEIFLKDNPDVSINLDFSTETSWNETLSGEKIHIQKEIKSDLSLIIDF